MRFIENLLSKIGVFVVFIILEAFSMFLMFNNNGYQKSVIGKGIMSVNGYFSGKVNYITHYFNLPEENKSITEENARLKQALSNYKIKATSVLDSSFYKKDSIGKPIYLYKTAQIVDYSLRKKDNYFLINKGSENGIKEDMAVLSPKGVVGAVLSTSKHYSSVISILNSKTNIKARVKGLKYFGVIKWPGYDHRKLSLTEIPRYLNVKLGDTVVTAGASAIYPPNQLIGKVTQVTPNEKTGDFNIEVTTFEDLANVRNVYVVENLDKPEIESVRKTETELSNGK